MARPPTLNAHDCCSVPFVLGNKTLLAEPNHVLVMFDFPCHLRSFGSQRLWVDGNRTGPKLDPSRRICQRLFVTRGRGGGCRWDVGAGKASVQSRYSCRSLLVCFACLLVSCSPVHFS